MGSSIKCCRLIFIHYLNSNSSSLYTFCELHKLVVFIIIARIVTNKLNLINRINQIYIN